MGKHNSVHSFMFSLNTAAQCRAAALYLSTSLHTPIAHTQGAFAELSVLNSAAHFKNVFCLSQFCESYCEIHKACSCPVGRERQPLLLLCD